MFKAVLLLQQQRVPVAAESSSLWLRPPTVCSVSNIKALKLLNRRARLFYFFNSDNYQSPEAWTNQLSG